MTTLPPEPESASGRIRNIDDLSGPAGRLEAILNLGGKEASYSVLLSHPHPLGGGTMHNKVVYYAMKSFQSLGLPVLRFNFRGAGLSDGAHDGGRGEPDDVRAGLDWLQREFHLPILFAGFSFGANVGLRACCGDARVKGLVALGLPVRTEVRDYRYDFLPGCEQPKLFVSGAEDEYAPQAELEAIVAGAAPPARLILVRGTGHFFTGKLEEMQLAVAGWIESQFLSGGNPGNARGDLRNDGAARSILNRVPKRTNDD